MATNHSEADPTLVQLSTATTPGHTHVGNLTEASAKKASELLTVNHSSYHTRWKGTFHNHLTHHLLSLWALGATPGQIQDMWEYNTPYQTSMERSDKADKEQRLDLKDPQVFEQCLGKDECYVDFLQFFEEELRAKGMRAVVEEYVLKGDERADDIFCRMYTDLVHPMIHLGCGLEFNQPSIVAEALAGACVHANWPKDFLLPTESYVRSKKDAPIKPLLQILEELRKDPVITNGVKATDPFNKIPDGFLKRVTAKDLVLYLSQVQVKPEPEDLQRKLGDMMFTNTYVMGAAQQPGKLEAMDFVLLHTVTLAVFYPAILALDWISDANKARLLEAKARVDIVMYAGCGSPQLFPERVLNYIPRQPNDNWPELFQRSIVYRDEGHLAKVVRALYSLEQLDERYVPELPIRKQDFIKITHMALDSAERAIAPNGNLMPEQVVKDVAGGVGFGGEMVTDNLKRFVFYGGLDQAWRYVPDKEGTAVEP
ncbi:hypothetical protein CC80DRAFT_596415 [Byssothecium circinans]|uniref:Oxidoreductase AflY n=1 Tax=Byssothecium circinans TaxID=147558 RepID=A0A6A5TUJ5_9PLEO|nr:hypothetical protein CC80DRAFT_596415 [Byssothecium circinans]